MNTDLGPSLRRWLDTHGEELIAFRRHLHAHPEPSGKEHETTRFIQERLEVAGLEPRILSTGTGLICDVGDGDGPLIALRGDIDALEMDDEKDVHYRSRVPGVAHACGHDVHTTVVLGAGVFLAGMADRLGGRVRLIFQPAEEQVPGGALEVIDDGGLKDVDVILGLHCDPKLDVGRVGVRVGSLTSAADMATIRLTGPGGHTARPELTVDMIRLLGHLVSQLPDRVAVELGGEGPFKLVFGAVHSGEAANVIPTNAVARCSIRTPLLEVWDGLEPAFRRAVADIVGDSGASFDVTYTRGVPPVVNDPEITRTMSEAVARALSPEAVIEAQQSWGGEDYAWYLQHVRGTFLRLGTHDPDSDAPHHDLHVGRFDVDERAIEVGVRVLTAGVAAHLPIT